jgi:hypothetical protein
VWFWKINNVKNSLTESNQFYSNVKSKKRVLIKKLQQWPFFEYLFRKIYYLKARKQLRARGAQLLNKVMVQPHLTIERSLLDDLIRSKGVSFITEDELAMKWAEHRDHL